MLIDDGGCWLESCGPVPTGGGALFFDRDRVLIDDPGYIHEPRKVRLLPGAGALVAAANRAGVAAIVISNQSGIARGLYGWEDFCAVNARMRELLSANAARLDAVLACAWHPRHGFGLPPRNHHWRKPGPGMILAAAEYFGIELAHSWLIGDRISDIGAARRAGLAGAVLLGAFRRGDCASPTFRLERRCSNAALLACPGALSALLRPELRG